MLRANVNVHVCLLALAVGMLLPAGGEAQEGGDLGGGSCAASYKKLADSKCLLNAQTCTGGTDCGTLATVTRVGCAKDVEKTAAINKAIEALKCSQTTTVRRVGACVIPCATSCLRILCVRLPSCPRPRRTPS